MHALVHIYIRFLGGSTKSLASSKELFYMQLYLFVCCFPRDTRLKSFSLHLYTFIQLQIRFKTHLND